MKSLDITSPNRDLHLSSDRQVTIKFVGGTQRSRLQTGYTYTVSIPYSSLSQRIKQIHRIGGKVLDVTISHFELTTSSILENKVTENLVLVTEVEPVEESLLIEAVSSEQDNQQEGNQVDVIEPVAIGSEIREEATEVPTEAIVETEKTVALIESVPVIEPKPKRSKVSSKAGSGFNKPKAEAKTTRSSKKPRS
ncbi:MAG: hypothetical protein DCE90_02975 [Pseudanabaena sp.]|nr:MAG: hypothetical protein DCE90_02975 [Pseudanabaena sp.]